MAKPEQTLTATGRSASEIGFVLRRAKWRSGPEVLRDIARADAEPLEIAQDRAAAEGAKSKRAKAPTRRGGSDS